MSQACLQSSLQRGSSCASRSTQARLTIHVAAQQYPGVAHYAYSHVFPDPQAGNILEVVEAAMANATTPQSLIIIDIIEDGAGAKSNDDTAYSWRGNYVTYIWAFWTRTEGVPCSVSAPVHQWLIR